jgi:DNA (cytosine-5)-methyltransferase 1
LGRRQGVTPLSLPWRTRCAVEIAPYARRILLARQRDGILPAFPIWDDIRTFDGRPWRGHIDVISAGFPCTPFSVAGKREAGDSDKNMWPDTIRRPKHLLLENVPGLLAQSHGYMHTILGDLAESGYDCRWDCIPASALGANHQRDRLWIVANHHSANLRHEPGRRSGESLQSMATQRGGRLSPSFVERMMNWPVGWTDLEPLAMDKYQQWYASHGECSHD